AGCRGHDDQPGLSRAHAVQGGRATRRGPARRRGGVRRRVEVPGPDKVRPARLDGLEGRDRAGHGGGAMTENVTETTETTETAELTAEQEDVLEAMRDGVDPELGRTVGELGLRCGAD